MFSNKSAFGSQLISTVGVRKVQLTDWNRKLCIWCAGFCAVFANSRRTAHLALHPLASIYLPTIRNKKRLIQLGQTDLQSSAFCPCQLVFMWPEGRRAGDGCLHLRGVLSGYDSQSRGSLDQQHSHQLAAGWKCKCTGPSPHPRSTESEAGRGAQRICGFKDPSRGFCCTPSSRIPMALGSVAQCNGAGFTEYLLLSY